MAILTPPTTAEVRDDAGLAIEQVSRSYESGDLDTDIAQKIVEQTNRVEGRVRRAARPYPFPYTADQLAAGMAEYSEAERAAWQTAIQATLTLVVKYFSLAALYRRSGQLSEAYQAKADVYEALGERILTGDPTDDEDTGVIGEITDIATEAGADTGGDGVHVLTIAVGEDFPDEDEV
jgi:hypothetical protein